MSVHEILEELSFMDINNEFSFGDSDTVSNWDDDGDEYADVDGEGAANPVADPDDDDVDLDFFDEGISTEYPNAPREMVYRERFYNMSHTTDPQLQLYCYSSSFVAVHTPGRVERLCLMCHYSAIVNNNEYYAYVDMHTTATLDTVEFWCYRACRRPLYQLRLVGVGILCNNT
ncbi:hypothetical protein JTB14_026875 [Gonioctena quinquepunctata]|nr:hypothetical protein JTB14_026875 [Gonioctena quinquepunctata]